MCEFDVYILQGGSVLISISLLLCVYVYVYASIWCVHSCLVSRALSKEGRAPSQQPPVAKPHPRQPCASPYYYLVALPLLVYCVLVVVDLIVVIVLFMLVCCILYVIIYTVIIYHWFILVSLVVLFASIALPLLRVYRCVSMHQWMHAWTHGGMDRCVRARMGACCMCTCTHASSYCDVHHSYFAMKFLPWNCCHSIPILTFLFSLWHTSFLCLLPFETNSGLLWERCR